MIPDNAKWDPIDECIFNCRQLDSLLLIRQQFGVGLKEAKEMSYSRYIHLLETNPGAFNCPHQDCYQGTGESFV